MLEKFLAKTIKSHFLPCLALYTSGLMSAAIEQVKGGYITIYMAL